MIVRDPLRIFRLEFSYVIMDGRSRLDGCGCCLIDRLSLVYLILAAIMAIVMLLRRLMVTDKWEYEYTSILIQMAWYIFHPFGKFVTKKREM
jgi:hypothetical protein